MKILRNLATRRSTMILGVMALSLILRADGCVTEERNLNGSVPIEITAEFLTEGFLEPDGVRYTLSTSDVDEIIASLDDLDSETIEAVRNAIDPDGGGREVLIGGLRAYVVENRGNIAARTGSLELDLGGGLEPVASLNPTTNATGSEASFANGGIELAAGAATGLTSLKGRLNDFLSDYLDGNLDDARSELVGLAFEATWETADPEPTQTNQDDFDWAVEVIVLIPAQYAIEVPNF